MVFGSGGDEAEGALLAVVAVVIDPLFTEHEPAEAVGPLLLLAPVAVAVVGVGPVFGHVEGMRGRPHSDHRLAGPQVVVDVLHLLVGQVAEPGGDHHQVGIVEGLEAGDVLLLVGIDLARRRIDGVEHRAVEAVVGGEDPAQLGEGLLAAILFVAADEHDPLAPAGALGPGQRETRVASRDGGRAEQGCHGQERRKQERARGSHAGSPGRAGENAAWTQESATPSAGPQTVRPRFDNRPSRS